MANSYNQELIQALRIFNRGDYHEARRKFTQLVSVKDKDPQIRLWLGAACFEVGYFDDARTHWQQSLELTSDPKLINLIHTSLAELEQVESQFKQLNSYTNSAGAEPVAPSAPSAATEPTVADPVPATPTPEVVSFTSTVIEVLATDEDSPVSECLSPEVQPQELLAEKLLSEDIPDDIAFEDIFPEFVDTEDEQASVVNNFTPEDFAPADIAAVDIAAQPVEVGDTVPEQAVFSSIISSVGTESLDPEDPEAQPLEAELDLEAELSLETELGTELSEMESIAIFEVEDLAAEGFDAEIFDVGGDVTTYLNLEHLESENNDREDNDLEDLEAWDFETESLAGEDLDAEAPAPELTEAMHLTTADFADLEVEDPAAKDLDVELNSLMATLDYALEPEPSHQLPELEEIQDLQPGPAQETIAWEESDWQDNSWENEDLENEDLETENLEAEGWDITTSAQDRGEPETVSPASRARINVEPEVEAKVAALPSPSARRGSQPAATLATSPKRKGIGAGIRAAFWGICISLVSVGMTGAATYVITQESLHRQVQQVQQGQVINPLEEATYLNRRLLLGLLVVATGSTVAAVVITWLANKRSKQLLQHAIESTQRIAVGDFSTRVLIQGDDEIGQLGDSLNQMVVCLQTLFDELSHLKALDQQVGHAANLATAGISLNTAANLRFDDDHKVGTNSDEFAFGQLEELLDTVPPVPASVQASTKAEHFDFASILSSDTALSETVESPNLPEELLLDQDLMAIETVNLELIEVESVESEAYIPESVSIESSDLASAHQAGVVINLGGSDPFESLLMEMNLASVDSELSEHQEVQSSPRVIQEIQLQPVAFEPDPQIQASIQLPMETPVEIPVQSVDHPVLQTALAQLQLIHESVTNLTLQTRQQHQSTEEARQLLANGDATIARTADEFESLQTAVTAVNKRLSSLNLLSQQGSSVMDVIHQFAERTSQLAINAAIASERSAASTSLSGFSSLSGQVRSLAADAELVTEEVRHLVSALQSDLPQISHVLATGSERLQSNWQQVQLNRSQLHQIIDTLTPDRAVGVMPSSDGDTAGIAPPDPVTQLTAMVEDLQARVAELRSNLSSVGAKV
jgi:methyl-accepting chemotaxis protein